MSMKINRDTVKYFGHCFLLFVELFGLFLLIGETFNSVGQQQYLRHENAFRDIVLLSVGSMFLAMVFMAKFASFRLSVQSNGIVNSYVAILFITGAFLLGVGAKSIIYEHAEWFQGKTPCEGYERMEEFKGVKVCFDPQDGTCDDRVRICKLGESYCENMNLYPSEDDRHFTCFKKTMLNIPRGLFYVSIGGDDETDRYANYFTRNVVSLISAKETWSYVIEMLELEGRPDSWVVGQSWSTNHADYAQLELGKINCQLLTNRVVVTRLTGADWSEYNQLDRAYIFVQKGHFFRAKFHVSLFAGAGVDVSNYHYVKPGETISCPLPIPSRTGYVFGGWYDGERRITEQSRVEKQEPHTLTAHWQKP